MRLLTPVPFALFGGFLAGHGLDALVDLAPLFGAILLLYTLLALAEVASYASQAREGVTARRPRHVSVR